MGVRAENDASGSASADHFVVVFGFVLLFFSLPVKRKQPVKMEETGRKSHQAVWEPTGLLSPMDTI